MVMKASIHKYIQVIPIISACVFSSIGSVRIPTWYFSVNGFFTEIFPTIWPIRGNHVYLIPSYPSHYPYSARRYFFCSRNVDVWQRIWSALQLYRFSDRGGNWFFACSLLWRKFCSTYPFTKKYQKFDQLLTRRTKDIKKVLIVTLLLPFAPDDLICIVAGLTKLTFREYMQIVILKAMVCWDLQYDHAVFIS